MKIENIAEYVSYNIKNSNSELVRKAFEDTFNNKKITWEILNLLLENNNEVFIIQSNRRFEIFSFLESDLSELEDGNITIRFESLNIEFDIIFDTKKILKTTSFVLFDKFNEEYKSMSYEIEEFHKTFFSDLSNKEIFEKLIFTKTYDSLIVNAINSFGITDKTLYVYTFYFSLLESLINIKNKNYKDLFVEMKRDIDIFYECVCEDDDMKKRNLQILERKWEKYILYILFYYIA